MSFEDFYDAEEETRQRRGKGGVWTALTLLVLLATLCLGGYFLMIFINPYSALNPFPPPTLPPTLGFPTATATLPFATLPPTWTPSPSPTLPATATPPPAATATPVVEPATATPTPAVSPTPMPYGLQPGSPAYLTSTIWHPDEGCNYLGVAGQLLDTNGQPLVGLPVAIKVEGTLADAPVQFVAIPGTAPHVGPAGFEITLADHPIASQHTLYIQVVDLNNFFPLSEPVYFDTHDTCEENVVLINFQRRP